MKEKLTSFAYFIDEYINWKEKYPTKNFFIYNSDEFYKEYVRLKNLLIPISSQAAGYRKYIFDLLETETPFISESRKIKLERILK